MKTGWYRILMIVAGIALCVFLAIQARWFRDARKLHENQFDRNVNLALRQVADRLLKGKGDSVSRVAPVRQTSTNTFQVKVETSVDYQVLDSLIKAAFNSREIVDPFQLSLHDGKTGTLMLGHFYADGVQTKTDSVSCLTRDQVAQSTYVIVSFPGKQSAILSEMDFWTYSGVALICVIVIFSYIVFDLLRRNRLAQMKTDFVNNMTHELQTPITNISMASEVLRSGKLTDAKKTEQYLDIIFQENQRLKLHVEQVLQTARLERGELPLHKTKVDVHNILDDVISKFQLRLKKKGGHLTLQPSASHTVVLGDHIHLSNLFYNLLDNADKYSQTSTDITITTKNHEAGIEVSIADKGIGIKKEDHVLIFEKFYRAVTGNQHDIKGFGIGLAYVKEIVKAHGGTVTLTSEEHQGSCFNVWLQNC